MRIRILMFGPIAEAAGCAEADLELPPGSRAGEVAATLQREHPGLLTGGAYVLAVNAAYAAADRELTDGDEVALIPPVSGG